MEFVIIGTQIIPISLIADYLAKRRYSSMIAYWMEVIANTCAALLGTEYLSCMCPWMLSITDDRKHC